MPAATCGPCEERAPRLVHRVEGATLTSPPLEEVVAGDLLLVRPGEIVPVDGRLEREVAVLDESALTGESLPVERRGGDDVRSGAVNAGDAFTLRATSGAAESTYAGIVQLVAEAEAEASTAPFVRLADRYAAAFVAVSLLAAGVAWALSGLRRSGRRGPGRGDTLPADPRRADRHHRRALPRRLPRRDHQGRRRPGAPRPGPGAAARQDRHAHGRPARGHRGRPPRWGSR